MNFRYSMTASRGFCHLDFQEFAEPGYKTLGQMERVFVHSTQNLSLMSMSGRKSQTQDGLQAPMTELLDMQLLLSLSFWSSYAFDLCEPMNTEYLHAG